MRQHVFAQEAAGIGEPLGVLVGCGVEKKARVLRRPGREHDDARLLHLALFLRAPYAPVSKKPEKNVFVIDRGSQAIRTRGDWTGDFSSRRSTRMELLHDHTNPYGFDSGYRFELKSLEIGFQKHRGAKAGFEPIGVPTWVLSQNLEGKKVTVRAPYRHVVDFSPPFSGQARFILRLRFNGGQEFDSQDWHDVYVSDK